MKELIFLLEESSMLEVLSVLIPPLIPDDIQCRFIPHEGIKDLEKSIPRKLKAWHSTHAQFVIVRDKHSSDCKKVKQNLLELCRKGRRPDSLVRIVCHELESWYLGDLAAVENAYGLKGIAKRQSKNIYRDPDRLANAEQEMRRLVPMYQKIGGARRIAPYMDVGSNKSHSLHILIGGIRRLLQRKSM